jgi:hypothetical protein
VREEKRLDVNLAPGVVVVVPSERYVHLYNHLGCCFPSTQEKNIRDDAAPRKILKRKTRFILVFKIKITLKKLVLVAAGDYTTGEHTQTDGQGNKA